MTKKSDNDFMEALERGVRSVLSNDKATAKEKLDAVTAGAKLMQIKHKISDSGDDAGSFFKGA